MPPEHYIESRTSPQVFTNQWTDSYIDFLLGLPFGVTRETIIQGKLRGVILDKENIVRDGNLIVGFSDQEVWRLVHYYKDLDLLTNMEILHTDQGWQFRRKIEEKEPGFIGAYESIGGDRYVMFNLKLGSLVTPLVLE